MSHTIASLSERRWPMSPLLEIRLFKDRLEAWNGTVLERRIVLDTVSQVRLAVEAGGPQSLVVCRITGPGGEIAFSSRRAETSGWADNILDFQRMLVALHKALAPRAGEIAFLEGQSLKFRLAMSGAGAAILAAALGYCAYMAVAQGNLVLALAGAPFILVGAALAYAFRPGRPVAYDPAKLIARFGG